MDTRPGQALLIEQARKYHLHSSSLPLLIRITYKMDSLDLYLLIVGVVSDLLDLDSEPVLCCGGQVGEPHGHCQALCSLPSCAMSSRDNMKTTNNSATTDMIRQQPLL